jgi:hypothetical protein
MGVGWRHVRGPDENCPCALRYGKRLGRRELARGTGSSMRAHSCTCGMQRAVIRGSVKAISLTDSESTPSAALPRDLWER